MKDLTGFEGRCDAILFTKDKNVVIPNRKEDLSAFRKQLLNIPAKPEDGGHYDLVVVGAGTAGLSAAIKGAREGLKVALINNRPVPGGNNSTEIRVVASGEMNVKPYTALGNVIREIRNVYSKEDQVIEMIQTEKTLSYFPNMHVFAVSKEGKQIKSVTAKHIENGKEIEFFSSLFVDCSGDGNLGYLAGAEYRVGREMRQETRETLAPDRPDNMVLGATISWKSKVMPAEVSFRDANGRYSLMMNLVKKLFLVVTGGKAVSVMIR